MKLLKNIFVVSIAFGLFFSPLNAVSQAELSEYGKNLLIVCEIMELFFRARDKAERRKIAHCLSTQGAFVDDQGRSVLHLAAQLNDQAKACQIMMFLFQVQGTQYINQQDNSGMAPLHIAAQAGHGQTVCYLLEKGADVALSDKSKKVPFEHAHDGGHKEIRDYLLELYQETVMKNYSGLSYGIRDRTVCYSNL